MFVFKKGFFWTNLFVVRDVFKGRSAINQIFRVINEQSQATFDADFNFISYYNWTGGNRALSPMVDNHGTGEPKAYTGLVGTHHRPSDDLSIFGKYFHLSRTMHGFITFKPFWHLRMLCWVSSWKIWRRLWTVPANFLTSVGKRRFGAPGYMVPFGKPQWASRWLLRGNILIFHLLEGCR